MPFVYVAGMWMAVFSSITFTAVYAWRVAEEARLLANALAATELVLQREQHLSALDGLAAAAAHELGTPLATITVVAKEMERTLGNDPKYREDVTLLRSQSERCREILKRLTSLSSEGEAHLDRLPLTSLVEEVIAPHRDFGISITLRPGERIGPRTGRTSQSRRHLRPRQSGRERRRFRPQDRHRALELGRRAPSPSRSSTMVRAFRRRSSTASASPTCRPARATKPGGGLGLGLFIAKTLLERSGATLDFRNSNERGEGAIVQISWRRDRSSTGESARPPCSTPPDVDNSGSAESYIGVKFRQQELNDDEWRGDDRGNGRGEDTSLLLVDDDKPFLTRLARAMEARGFVVETAESVEEAVAKAHADPPAYAVVDMRLGDGNGLDVVAAIREKRADTRTVILTGYGNIATAVTAVKLGAIDYLSKPADADDIFAALTRTGGERAAPPENPMSADRVRWEHIQRVYEMCDRNVSETARRLNMHRRTLQRILAKRAPR